MDWNVYDTYEMLIERMHQLEIAYSPVLQVKMIGKSHDERPIPMMQLGFGEKTLICTGGVHGREIVNPGVLTAMTEEYCMAYEEGCMIDGFDVKRLLLDYTICIIPLLNPDGYMIAQYGFEQIENPVLRHSAIMKGIPYIEWKYNARGVDINRNFPAKSYRKQFPGDYPMSENETRALIRVFQSYKTFAYIDVHSRGKCIYFYRNAMSKAYNQRQQHIAEKLVRLTGYTPGQKEEEFMDPKSGGNTVHYYSEYYKKPAITIETVPEEADFPLDVCYLKQTFCEIHTCLLAMLMMQNFD